MIRIPVTADEMGAAVDEIHAALPKFGLGPESMPKVIRIYREALHPYDGEAVRGAGKLLLRTVDKFPSPAAWREACREWVKRNRATVEYTGEQDREGRSIVCRTCRSVPRAAWLRIPFARPEPLRAIVCGVDTVIAYDDRIQRSISPCDVSRHGGSLSATPLPENFIEWVA